MKPSSRFFIAGVGAAASPANAMRPVASGGPVSIAAFLFGRTPSELPLQTGISQLGAAALLARGGGTRGWRGKLGIVAYVASAAGLVAIHKTARKSGEVLEAALVDEL